MISLLKVMTQKVMLHFPHLHTGVEEARRVDRFSLAGKFYILFVVFFNNVRSDKHTFLFADL